MLFFRVLCIIFWVGESIFYSWKGFGLDVVAKIAIVLILVTINFNNVIFYIIYWIYKIDYINWFAILQNLSLALSEVTIYNGGFGFSISY